jgi:hypothetical protein
VEKKKKKKRGENVRFDVNFLEKEVNNIEGRSKDLTNGPRKSITHFFLLLLTNVLWHFNDSLLASHIKTCEQVQHRIIRRHLYMGESKINLTRAVVKILVN